MSASDPVPTSPVKLSWFPTLVFAGNAFLVSLITIELMLQGGKVAWRLAHFLTGESGVGTISPDDTQFRSSGLLAIVVALLVGLSCRGKLPARLSFHLQYAAGIGLLGYGCWFSGMLTKHADALSYTQPWDIAAFSVLMPEVFFLLFLIPEAVLLLGFAVRNDPARHHFPRVRRISKPEK